MPRGRSSTPTPLPKGFSSWGDLYKQWEDFLQANTRSVRPSRATRFAENHQMPEWILGTLPYIFRTARRQDAVGEFARQVIDQIDRNQIGVPKANNLIRAFAQQNPMFRTKETQDKAVQAVAMQLDAIAKLADTVRNFNADFSVTELEEVFSSISQPMRRLQQLKNRVALALRDAKQREEESPLD